MPFKDYVGDFVGFGVSATLSYAFYTYFKTTQRLVHTMRETPELTLNSSLIKTLNESKEKAIAAVCVSGTVKALDTPIKSVAFPDVSGVIWNKCVKEHVVAQVMGFWLTDERTVKSEFLSIPFMIFDKGVGVMITEPNNLDDAALSIVSDKFEPISSSLAEHIWSWLVGFRPTGIQTTEKMLTEGTRVMGIGRLVQGNEGMLLEYTNSIPYIVTTQSKEGVIKEWQAPLPYVGALAILTGCGAMYYGYRVLTRYFKRWKSERRRKLELRQLEEARQQHERLENDLPEGLLCVICYGLRDVCLIPCHHVCVCGSCALKIESRLCPVCRTHIETIQPLIYS
ncbi:mitochondrial E3 ubiquitin protein ligase 1-like [Oratosquilla oratoria]|uniref:mitochondrial E3 ubiquitin protein ligase 1-like n=1 Tax=Oratosquilla oratoria TaxID=337810 RepID=UPI003F76ADCF